MKFAVKYYNSNWVHFNPLNMVISPTGYNGSKVNWTVLEMHVSGVLQIHAGVVVSFSIS